MQATLAAGGGATYDETVAEVRRVAAGIELVRSQGDGRIDSAMKEGPFLLEMQRQLLAAHPTWEIEVSRARAACDVMVNSVRINLKLTDCASSDNSMNKPSVFYSITGSTDYPYSSTWNDFNNKLAEAKRAGQIKLTRDRATEYHYLAKNKKTGAVVLKPIFDIHTYVPNPSNDLQINWKNEFKHADETTPDEAYPAKVRSLLECIQTSVREMIRRTREFAEADMGALFTE
jgi:hypothetical protein